MKAPKVKQTTPVAYEPPVPLPDMQDAAIRKTKSEALSRLLKQRGRSSTIFSHKPGSGQISDQGRASQTIKAMVSRG